MQNQQYRHAAQAGRQQRKRDQVNMPADDAVVIALQHVTASGFEVGRQPLGRVYGVCQVWWHRLRLVRHQPRHRHDLFRRRMGAHGPEHIAVKLRNAAMAAEGIGKEYE